ncbi:MAG: hypothetical protein MJY77_05180 [Bacteroidaceae bacterium]|nr:hypothetical protein [Bacteroidaceae bacterium]
MKQCRKQHLTGTRSGIPQSPRLPLPGEPAPTPETPSGTSLTSVTIFYRNDTLSDNSCLLFLGAKK